ncbi:hypothetical protein N7532_008247 [Penicillium argentinense]|uniref:Up-regulated during septation protein 1 domain-containing protein n=1 Tax=Penicillium argentinense TaxID=1131581 RepID=A0A9W9K1F5_9EURO|nr:uncharacterized protein N7532_008247 [Penicillium argentinense]KAJ5089563.1 hypothetical protein N7532_008247 [Penicillium argentinense]
MNISLRSSQSSYGDPRYLSTATASDVHAPVGKSLVDGYRDAVDPQHEDRSRYNPVRGTPMLRAIARVKALARWKKFHQTNQSAPFLQLNAAHPRSSALVNTNDPVTLYLLTETAIGDSNNFEILSLEEVEDLKKERTLLSSRIDGTKRKLTLETKLRDAAQSIGRLYGPPSPRDSGEYGANRSSKSHRRSRSIFGKSGTAEVLDKSDSELAVSQRKCEDLAQELWKLERRSQQINQRLLEHTAGVLQMTHKGMRKTPKNTDGSSDNLYDGHDFDDRSLYRTPEHLDDYGTKGRIQINDAPSSRASSEAMEATQRKLEELSERMCNMLIQATPDEFVNPPPQSSERSIDPAAATEAHLAYIETGLNTLESHPISAVNGAPAVVSSAPAPETEGAWKQQITDVNERVQSIVDRFGLTRSPTLPPPPSAYEGEGLEEQLSYLQAGIDGLASRVDGLLEQKSILTTQIQQQRELNSKSDAERDAHIGDLTEQLSHARRDGKSAQDELAVVMEQLEAMRRDGSTQDEAKASLVQAEGEIARLQSVVESLHREADARTEEVREARDRAEYEASQTEARTEEMREARDRAEQLAAQLEADIQQIRSESDSRVQEADTRAQDSVSRLQAAESRLLETEPRLQEAESRVREAEERAQEVVSRLQEAESRLQEADSRMQDVDTRIQEAVDQRVRAEENATRLQDEMTGLEGEVVRITTELTMVKAELDGAYGTRAQRAAEAAANPEFQNEMEALTTRNIELTEELAALKGKQGGGDIQQRADTLGKELRETIDDYEALVKSNVEFEKERERFEGVIDSLRDRCEQLEQQLSEERISWMNLSSPTMGRDPTLETTSTMVLKNEFKKMMRDTRNENMRILKAEQEERRRIEGLLRALKKEHAQVTGKPVPSPVGTPL